MKPLKMQPTFRLDVPIDAGQAIGKLRRAIKSPELRGHTESAGPCFDFKIGPEQQRFWSPQLSVQVTDTPEGAELFARFSPRPEIWTLFMMIYFAAAFVMLVALLYGYVQWFLGSPPWALIIPPIALLTIAGLHGASLVGQQLSADQMHLLRSRLDTAMQIAFGEQERADGLEEGTALNDSA